MKNSPTYYHKFTYVFM